MSGKETETDFHHLYNSITVMIVTATVRNMMQTIIAAMVPLESEL